VQRLLFPSTTLFRSEPAHSVAVGPKVAADGLVAATDVLLPRLARARQMVAVPVDQVHAVQRGGGHGRLRSDAQQRLHGALGRVRSEEDTSELQSREN